MTNRHQVFLFKSNNLLSINSLDQNIKNKIKFIWQQSDENGGLKFWNKKGSSNDILKPNKIYIIESESESQETYNIPGLVSIENYLSEDNNDCIFIECGGKTLYADCGLMNDVNDFYIIDCESCECVKV